MNAKTKANRRISVKSFAKINLALDVLKKEKTHHRLLTVFYQINLHDTIIFQTQKTPDIHLVCDDSRVPTNHKNTILQAANLVRKYAAGKPNLQKNITGLRIRLIKKIPPASGLGGASSNASVTLATLNRLWKLHIPQKKLQIMAATIGMDVPFFLHGGGTPPAKRGTAIGTHYGEKITSLPNIKNLPILIFYPPVKKISTKKMYDELNISKTGHRRSDTKKLIQYLSKSNTGGTPRQGGGKLDIIKIAQLLHNDFDTAKPLQQGKILTLRKKILRTAPLLIQTCGSGTAQMALYKTPRAMAKARRSLNDIPCALPLPS